MHDSIRCFIERLLEPVVEQVVERRMQTFLPTVDPTAFDEHHWATVTPQVGGMEYPLLKVGRPATFWLLVDLSNARSGDDFVVRHFVSLTGRKRAMYEKFAVPGEQECPTISLAARFSPASEVTVAQLHGASREIAYEVFVRYEDDSR